MRLDKFLKVSRLMKRRTLANEVCDAGRVTVNGKVARASYAVRPGDEITLTLGPRRLTARVRAVTESPRKEDAANMYEIIADGPA